MKRGGRRINESEREIRKDRKTLQVQIEESKRGRKKGRT